MIQSGNYELDRLIAKFGRDKVMEMAQVTTVEAVMNWQRWGRMPADRALYVVKATNGKYDPVKLSTAPKSKAA